jgi:signal transduction histidine kinase
MLLQEELLLHENGLSARGREHARRIGAAARRLDAMILNLLDISKADEGRLVPRLADLELSSLVEDVLLELSVQARSQNVFLRSSLSIGSVHVDHDLFRRTLLNLVENAIRYAPPETQITLTAVRFGSTTEIRVTDNGNGVPSEMREIVFEPFEQGDASGVDVHGSRGLGLAFCKRVVEAHRGRIWIEDREDGAPGAVFAISLPHPDESRVTPTPTNWSC